MKAFKWMAMVTLLLTSSLAFAGPGKGCNQTTDTLAEKTYISDDLSNDNTVAAKIIAGRCTFQKVKKINQGTFSMTIPLSDFPKLDGADSAFLIMQGMKLEDSQELEVVVRQRKNNLEIFLPAIWTPAKVGFEAVVSAFTGENGQMTLVRVEKAGKTVMVFGEDI